MSKDNSASEEDIARAVAFMRAMNRGLSEVEENVKRTFERRGLDFFAIFYSSDHNLFSAIVFYRWDRDIEAANASGLSAQVKQFVIDGLVAVGRGTQETIQVSFEFDSKENVDRNYGGSYYNRLR